MNSLPKTVTRQRRDCDLNPGPLRLSPARYPLGYRATHALGDSDVIIVPYLSVDSCRHLVGKTLINVCHCDSA